MTELESKIQQKICENIDLLTGNSKTALACMKSLQERIIRLEKKIFKEYIKKTGE